MLCLLGIIVLLAETSPRSLADEECAPSGDLDFVCGLVNPEDLVRVPDSHWIISSGMGDGGALYLVDTDAKSRVVLYPGDAPQARQDMGLYGSCPGSPDPNQFVSHGLNLQPGTAGHSTLYVVGHGEREAIEVFDVDATGERPILTWTGCVLTPDGLAANSVASSRDGSLLATIPLFAGVPISDALAGKPTGAVFKWAPGDDGFIQVAGTEMPYANGIEVSSDGKEFFVASSGLFNVTAFSNTNPARVLRRTGVLDFLPDNLRMSEDGELLTAGLNIEDPVCGQVTQSEAFDLGEFASCPRGFTVWAIDSKSMRGRALLRAPANEHFSNVTMGLPVGESLWIGAFAGDRIAYVTLAPSGSE
jgi:hypothetical protein